MFDRNQKLECCLMLLGTRFFIHGGNGSEIFLHFPPAPWKVPPILACRPDLAWPDLPVPIHGSHHFHKQLELAEHVAALPAHRWVERLLCRHAVCTRRHTWEPHFIHIASMRILDMKDAAFHDILWNSLLDSSVDFCRMKKWILFPARFWPQIVREHGLFCWEVSTHWARWWPFIYRRMYRASPNRSP